MKPTCLAKDCTKTEKLVKGYCNPHYTRWRRWGDPHGGPVRKNPPCAEPGCRLLAARRGYCRPHARDHFGRKEPKGYKYGKKDNPYIAVYAPDHPNAFPSNGYVPEHVKVMTEVLGRALYLGETVHHKNGVRWDNTPGNLELWVTSQPAGQRPADLVVWAREILKRYGDGVSRD